MKDFLALSDLTRDQLQQIFDTAFALRQQRQAGQPNPPLLAGRTLAMIFDKASLRTRVSFEQAIVELGGHAIILGDDEVGLGRRESVSDVARVLAGMVHGIIARVSEHQKLLDMAAAVPVPVINALSDRCHPVQVLADAMTLMDEFGKDLAGRTLAFIGDGHNVARSLAMICAMLDMQFVIATPPGYELDSAFVDDMQVAFPGVNVQMTFDASEAVREADAVYTDTWVSMGQENEAERRRVVFADYQINAKLLKGQPEHGIVLHCLPAYRGKEITDEIMDGARSRIFGQAFNRLHAQKGLLALLFE